MCTQGRFAVTARTIAGLAELTSLRRLDTAYTVAPLEAPASLNEFAALTGARAWVHLCRGWFLNVNMWLLCFML